jgi:hypothetical protein
MTSGPRAFRTPTFTSAPSAVRVAEHLAGRDLRPGQPPGVLACRDSIGSPAATPRNQRTGLIGAPEPMKIEAVLGAQIGGLARSTVVKRGHGR